MKTKKVLYLVVGLLFLATFFLDIIPIKIYEPTQNLDINAQKTYETYWFSAQELNSGNTEGTIVYFSFFIILAGGNYLINGKHN